MDFKDLIVKDYLSYSNYEKSLIFNGLHNMFSDKDVVRYSSHGAFAKSIDDINRYYQHLDFNKNIIWSIFRKDTNDFAGNVSLLNIDFIYRNAEFACIFNKSFWNKGYCTYLATELFNHAFNCLNLNKIWLGTTITNLAMNRVAIKLKMKREAILEKHGFLCGEYIDIIRYCVFKDDWDNGR